MQQGLEALRPVPTEPLQLFKRCTRFNESEWLQMFYWASSDTKQKDKIVA